MIFKNESTLLSVLHEIMAEMFFIFPDMDDNGVPTQFIESFNAYYCTSIDYGNGDFLFFEWDRNMLNSMAANFLGAEQGEVTDAQIQSMALEATNVIGGRYLVLVDPDKKRSLSLPHFLRGKEIDTYKSKSPIMHVGFVSDEKRCALRVSAYHKR
ncbi:MAG TPA: chemotaxis protein CheX [Balneolales bacterium]|jgi:hypothetical protein|nr:chemotaxis protein CheX [Balneolales bacterium]